MWQLHQTYIFSKYSSPCPIVFNLLFLIQLINHNNSILPLTPLRTCSQQISYFLQMHIAVFVSLYRFPGMVKSQQVCHLELCQLDHGLWHWPLRIILDNSLCTFLSSTPHICNPESMRPFMGPYHLVYAFTHKTPSYITESTQKLFAVKENQCLWSLRIIKYRLSSLHTTLFWHIFYGREDLEENYDPYSVISCFVAKQPCTSVGLVKAHVLSRLICNHSN